MTGYQPFREPLRVTLMRTLSIAIIAGALVALSAGRIRLWPAMSVLMLWPSFGGHWIDLLFLNVLRPRLPEPAPFNGSRVSPSGSPEGWRSRSAFD